MKSGADGSGGEVNELYDPDSRAWSEAAAPIEGRYYHTATLMPSGQVLALGGYPSSLATEYLVYALQHAGALAERPTLHLFSVVDYDPSGYWIAREFTAQLHAFGVQEVTRHPLIRPERLTTEQVALGRYTLPKGSKTTNWVRETGGIDGEPYGLEADAFAPDVIRAAFVAAARKAQEHRAGVSRRGLAGAMHDACASL